MSNYDRKISYTTLDSKTIQEINNIRAQNPKQKILIEIPNTKGISSELIKKLDPSVSIRIAGGYDKDRVARLGNVVYKNGETGQYYTDAVIYDRNEVVSIIKEMEKIEKDFEGQDFSDFEKMVHIYGKLKSGIMYDPKVESKPSSEIRSLRGLVSKETVCAGYAMIFKEMLDRQGIKCHYVEGKTAREGGHAWNVVSLDGKNYPIDLTWDNTNFRSGKSKTYDYLAQNVEEFKKHHIPHAQEPCKNLELSELDPEKVKTVSQRMSREKDYQSTTYYGTRNDGSKYMIAQVGDAEKNGKKYFRYYYADILANGQIANQNVLFSSTNVTHFIEQRKFGKPVPDGYEEAVDNVLFSKENIQDSLARGTSFIGGVRKGSTNNKPEFVKSTSEISKEDEQTKMFRFPTKTLTRSDGTSFIVQQMNKDKDINGIPVNVYHIFEVINEGNRRVVKRNVVYSERDFLQDNREGIANDFLSRDRLDRKVGEAGGYIGYYDEKGIRTYNPALVQYFKSIESGKTTPSKKEEPKKLDDTTQTKPLDESQQKRKMQWVKDFLSDYEATEKNTAHALRTNLEDANIKRVIDSIKSGRFIEEFDNNAEKYKSDPGWYMGKLMPAMARLLKEADNLTIDGGEDFLEKFVNIPEVNKLLLQIKKSDDFKKMHAEAEENRRTGNLPTYKKTPAELDKENAQAYLKGNDLSQSTVQKEIDYRKGILSRGKIRITTERDITNIPLVRQQQISLTRILARQEGKVPSEPQYDEKLGWYCLADISEKQQPSVQLEEIAASPSIDAGYLTPNSLTDSTLRVGVGRNEINSTTQDIRRTQTRDIEQAQVK